MKKIIFTAALIFISMAAECSALEIILSDSVQSNYITKSGSRIGKGPVNQSLFSADVKGWYGTAWNNYDLALGKTMETDLIFGKKFSTENYVGKFTIDASYQRWLEEKANENILEVAIKYKGLVSGSVVWTKQVTDGLRSDRNRFHLELSKSFPLQKLAVTPAFSAAYLDNFYGFKGWAHVTGKLKVEYALNEHASLFVQGNAQKGLLPKKDDLIYGGGGVKFIF